MNLTRRALLKASLATALCGVAPSLAFASLPESRQLRLHNIHTGESIKTTYWDNGNYHALALADIAYVLRDHRTGEVNPIDVKLLDLITALHARMQSNAPFEVISGFRSAKSNALLHETTSGVAVNSLHMSGRAIDIRLGDRSTRAIRDAAIEMQAGGVGFYPASDFVHVDTGNVRRW